MDNVLIENGIVYDVLGNGAILHYREPEYHMNVSRLKDVITLEVESYEGKVDLSFSKDINVTVNGVNVLVTMSNGVGSFNFTPDIEGIDTDSGVPIITDIFSLLTLKNAQTAKTAEIQQAYNRALNAGFSSSATGISYQFAYGQENQLKLMKLALDVLSGNVTFPVPIPASDGTIVMHTEAQYQQFAKDVSEFEWTLQNKLHGYIGPTGSIAEAATIDEVNAITW